MKKGKNRKKRKKARNRHLWGAIAVIGMAVAILAGCSAKGNDSANKSAGSETVTDQDALPVDISIIEQIYTDEYEKQAGNLQSVQPIIDRLADYGVVAIDSDNKVDMANAEKMRQFIDSLESGENAKVLVHQVFYSGGLNLLEIVADKGNVSVKRTYYTFQDNCLSNTVNCEFEADYCKYTDEGYLIIEGYWHSPEWYAFTLSEKEEHIALRVEPLDKQCRELNKKYMEPVSYNLNNMFIIDWNEDDFADLDFYDIFERFYKETYGKDCPYTMNDDLSVGNEYEIPADEFENIIMRHIRVSPEELHTLLRYDADKDIYIYRPRGFYEFDYAEVPYPEVVAFETNDDGSMTLTVNAVYPNDNTSKLFSHKVTVVDENGKIYYHSNEILGDEELNLWWHSDRQSDDEWDEYYNGGDDE